MGNQRIGIVEKIDNTPTLYLNFADHLNSSSVTTDSQGNITNLIDYLPYGTDRVNVQLGTFNPENKFTGQKHDNESDLYNYGARYYNAAIGRFNQVDPQIMLAVANVLSDPQALNAYAYARNNPIRYIDPTGETFKEFLQGTAKGVWEGVKDLGQGLLQVAQNPAIIVTGVANFFGQAASSLDYLVSSYINDPTGTLNQIRDSLSYLVEGWENLSDEQKGQIIGYTLEKSVETYVAAKGLNKALNKKPELYQNDQTIDMAKVSEHVRRLNEYSDFEVLDNGNIRYFSKFKVTNTDGPAVSRRFVVEVDSTTNKAIRNWEELYNEEGKMIETREIN